MSDVAMKRCPACKEKKPATTEYFQRNKGKKYGLESRCKPCCVERQKGRHHSPETMERRRIYDLNRPKWGRQIIDERTVKAMLAEQGGRCAICGTSENKLVLDHDHKTGKIRQFLCNNCNMLVGVYEKRPILINRIAEYVRTHGVGLPPQAEPGLPGQPPPGQAPMAPAGLPGQGGMP